MLHLDNAPGATLRQAVQTESRPTILPAPQIATPLDDVLRTVNRIRIEHGADPLYELPKARPAFEPGSTCVLQRAFEDIGVLSVDYERGYGRGLVVEHGLGVFIRRFDAGRYPELVE